MSLTLFIIEKREGRKERERERERGGGGGGRRAQEKIFSKKNVLIYIIHYYYW